MRTVGSIAVLAALLSLGACASTRPTAGAADSEAMFERFKSLEGTWVMQGATEGENTPVTYEVTSGGSAVLETVFQGQPHEMVTLYFVDNGVLKLTHYCALKNQPHMVANPITSDDQVSFEAVSVGNTKSMDEAHMHWAEFKFVDDDHFESVWTIRKDGEPGMVANMNLVRVRSK